MRNQQKQRDPKQQHAEQQHMGAASDISSSEDEHGGSSSDSGTNRSRAKPAAPPVSHFVDDREVILIMKIMTPGGEKEIELRKGDDPQRAAESFVRMHHIHTQKIGKITDAIMANIIVETLASGGGYSAVAAKQSAPAPAASAQAPTTAPASSTNAAPRGRQASGSDAASDSSTSSFN